MNEKQVADKINAELIKMLTSGLINETQCEIITTMVHNITTVKEPLRVSYSNNSKYAYFNGKKFRKNFSGYYVREIRLHHVAVMEYYTGEDVSIGLDVHHNGKDESGNYDKSKNDIEHLLLMTRDEHQRLHATNEFVQIAARSLKNIMQNKNFVVQNVMLNIMQNIVKKKSLSVNVLFRTAKKNLK